MAVTAPDSFGASFGQMLRVCRKPGFKESRRTHQKCIAMKRNLWGLLIIITALYSCQKNNQGTQAIRPSRAIDARIEKGHLAFKTGNDYDLFLSKSALEKYNAVNGMEGGSVFTSFAKAKYEGNSTVSNRMIGTCEVPDSLIEDNQTFFSTLDANGVVQIDSIVYRYDYCHDGVYVISASDAQNSSYYNSFLSGNEVKNVVGFFPSYVDAIEAVSSGYKTMPDTNTVQGNEIFERTGIFGAVSKEHLFSNNNPKVPKEESLFDGKLAYDKFAIYFQFYGKEKYQTHCFFNWCTSTSGPRDWNVAYQYRCRRKGRSYDYVGSGTLVPPGSGENKVSKTFYDGSRGLKNGYNFALWDVNHVNAMGAHTERNGGSLWFQIGSIYLGGSMGYLTNWHYTNPFMDNHYNIRF